LFFSEEKNQKTFILFASATLVNRMEPFGEMDIRVGTVAEAGPVKGSAPALMRLRIDFGEEIGIKTSLAQITVHYRPDQLIGRQVLAVMNLGPVTRSGEVSEVLTLGVPGEGGDAILIRPDFNVPDGGRLY
jgi:tRNA-binding protein